MFKVSWQPLVLWSIMLLGCYAFVAGRPLTITSTQAVQATPAPLKTQPPLVSPMASPIKEKTPSPVVSLSPTAVFSYGDLHIHTICSDGKGNYEEMIEQAIKSELSFMAITDHRMNSAVCREIRQKCIAEKRLLCLPGMEVSGRVHLLAIGIQRSIDANLPLPSQVAEIHRQGGLAIAAHPFAPKWQYTRADFQSGLDAIECPWEITTPPVDHLCVYDSDSHDIYVANMLKCAGKITSFAALKDAILSKRCTRWDLDFPEIHASQTPPSATENP